MTEPAYEPLSSLDAAFLALEGPTTCMHVAATAILDCGPLRTAEGGVDVRRIRDYVASRLDSIPRYRQRLAYVPVENRPVWVDDEHFDLDFHVRHASLPKPGTPSQLQKLCARLLERQLDRRRPLWEIWVIEGVVGGRFALHMKVHHCMVDGIAGVDMMAALFRITPDATVEPTRPWSARPAPSDSELLRDEVKRRLSLSAAAVRQLPRWLRGDDGARATAWKRASNVFDILKVGFEKPAATPINVPVGPHRRVRWLTFAMDDVKAVKNSLGGTVNDVVLATVGGGLDRFLEQRGARPDTTLRIGVPVNLSSGGGGERGMGNHVWAWLVPMAPELRGPIRRYRALQQATADLKRSEQALGGEVIAGTFDWTTTNLLPLGVKLLQRLQPYNLLVTNVPGPQLPLYLLGARIDELYPWVPLFENQGIAIALFSYDGKLHWSIGADWDAVPDVDDFVAALSEAFRELQRAAGRKQRKLASQAPSAEPKRAEPDAALRSTG